MVSRRTEKWLYFAMEEMLGFLKWHRERTVEGGKQIESKRRIQ